MRNRLIAYAGLSQPRRPGRTLALLATLLFAAIVAGMALYLRLTGGLDFAAPRGAYFTYLFALAALAFLAVPWPRAAMVVLSILALEIGLGMGSALLYKFRLSSSETLFPRNYTRPPYGWHPLLQAMPLPSPPDTAATARVFINSQRQRGRERTIDELRSKTVIALFGGSTTLDFVSPEGQAWPDRLEELLGRNRYAVINHGVASYTTSQNVIQTMFYESSLGVRPRCAVYYIGWNDLRSIHLRSIDPAYADFQVPTMIDSLEARRVGGPALSTSPTLSLVARLAVLAIDTARPAAQPPGTLGSAPDPRLEAIYARNVHTISAVNRDRGIVTLWIGQVMNRTVMTGDQPGDWIPYLPVKEIWPQLERLNTIVRREAAALNDIYIDVPVTDFQPQDFGDFGHFVPSGSLKFARHIVDAVRQHCPAP